MPKHISDEERMTAFFRTRSKDDCDLARERIDLILGTRFQELAPAKRGRRPRVKKVPPIAVAEVSE